MELTKKKAIKLHRELWDWLYHHPSKCKSNWPRWKHNGGNIPWVSNECFLCEYTKGDCPNCPLDWSPTTGCMGEGYFNKWKETPRTKKKYAKLIRDLPEK